MDPFTIALLAGAGLSAAQGIASSTANNQQQRLNKARLGELQTLQRQGGLGLTSTEERLMTQQAMNPVRREATANRTRMEQLMASAGGSASGADLSRLRTEESRQVGDALQQTAMGVRAADEAKATAQRNEMEARTAAKGQMKADDINAILGGFAAAAGPVGAALGAPPGTVQQGPLMGMQFSPSETALIKQLPPEDLQRLLDELGLTAAGE